MSRRNLAATNWSSLSVAEISSLGDADFVVNHYSHIRCSEILLELGAAIIFDTEHDVTRRNVRARVTISTDINDDTGRKRKRHADAQLAYRAGTLHKLQKVVGVWYHTLQPFGDG